MDEEKIILTATDFSEFSEYATEHAIGIAVSLGYKVKILHVVSPKKPKFSIDASLQKLKNITKKIYDKHRINADYILREGVPAKIIGDVASEFNASLVTIGTRGKTGVEYILGSYALKIITNCRMPVIVVQKSQFEQGYKNIVMPLDFTVQSTYKSKWAVKIAKDFDSIIHILILNEADEYYQNRLKMNVESVKQFFKDNDVQYIESISDEDETLNFAQRTLKYATNVDADLILIMTNTGNFFLPSVIAEPLDEQFIYNASRIPTMCVNPREILADINDF